MRREHHLRLPANALISQWIAPPLRPVASCLVPFNSPLEGHTGGTCGPTGAICLEASGLSSPVSQGSREPRGRRTGACALARCGRGGAGGGARVGVPAEAAGGDGAVEAVKDTLATLLEEASEVGRGLPRYVERDVSPVPGVRSAGARLRAGALRELQGRARGPNLPPPADPILLPEGPPGAGRGHRVPASLSSRVPILRLRAASPPGRRRCAPSKVEAARLCRPSGAEGVPV
jgi:hypothetical protein